MERRKNTRVAFQTTADLKFASKNYQQCETEDLCLKGMSVHGISGHAPGEKCDISLALSGSSSKLLLYMKGEVVRADEEGIALRFTEIDLDSFYHLKNIVYYNSADPDKIDSEMEIN